MAKDKRPIAVQVAELTPEQRKSIPRITLYHTLFTVLVAVVVIMVAVVPMFAAEDDYRDAVDEYDDAVDEWIKTGDELEKIYGDSYIFMEPYPTLGTVVDLTEEVVDEAKSDFEAKRMTAMIVFGAWVLVEVVIIVIIYKKYPYYSDRKCFYILRHRKEWG